MLEREREGEGSSSKSNLAIETAEQFLVRFRRRDYCCLSAVDVLYVVFCFVTHPTFIIEHVSTHSLSLSSAHISSRLQSYLRRRVVASHVE